VLGCTPNVTRLKGQMVHYVGHYDGPVFYISDTSL
jgi:hypothetical protein